jgi:hypothetical protein
VISYQTLGALCLAALWLMALLVAAAAGQELRALLALRGRFGHLGQSLIGVGLLRGEIEECLAPDSALARHEVVQVGRARADGRAIVFRDRTHKSRVTAGVVRVGDAKVHVAAAARDVAVWTSRQAKERAAYGDAVAFQAARGAAATATGFVRTVATSLSVGDRVFIAGEVVREGGALVIRAPKGGELLVAAEDPRGFVSRRARLVLSFMLGELLVCAVSSTLALSPPAFGRVGTVGGVLCLAFFLGVTPIGVWLRDRCRPPSRDCLHGVWTP